MFTSKSILAFLLTLIPHSIYTGYPNHNYEVITQHSQPVYYTEVLAPLAVENIALKYFNLFLTNPYEPTDRNLFSAFFNAFGRELPAVSERCPRDTFFASYNPNHREASSSLAKLYTGQTDFQTMLDLSQFFKTQPEIHPSVWYASFLTAQLSQMPETLAMQRPSPINLFPTAFFPEDIIRQTTRSPQECVFLDERFGQDNGIENLLWYFREDVQMNAHHWIWHLLYPVNPTQQIPRRGEFFYFYHHDLIARYGAERMSIGLPPQTAFNMQLDSIIEEGYNPHLMNGISTLSWASRPPFQNLATALNTTVFEQLIGLTVNKDRVIESLLAGTVFNGNTHVPIHTIDNINIVGELADASNNSINPIFYGMDGYHITGHAIFSNLIGNSAPGTIGVMGDVATAMRDPIFYRWHKFVDILFLGYKATHLAPYQLYEGEYPLIFKGVGVSDIKVIPDDAHGGAVNLLRTFWNIHRFNLEGGLDFNSMAGSFPPNVSVCAKHLDHEEFSYQIQMENHHVTAVPATVRIFMAPRFQSIHKKIRWTMSQQRSRFFTMDSFVTTLAPGNNVVVRRSIDSTLTAPWPKSIEQIRQEIISGVMGRTDCDCGYPHHLLLPKGTAEGMVFDLFVMVTDARDDHVVEPPAPQPQRPPQNFQVPQCTPRHIHCGIQGRMYPDAKPMGYPFDRTPFSVPRVIQHPSGKVEIKNIPAATLEEYVSHVPNMAATKVVIVHQNIQKGLEDFVHV